MDYPILGIINFESVEPFKFPTFHTKQSEDMESLTSRLGFLYAQCCYPLINSCGAVFSVPSLLFYVVGLISVLEVILLSPLCST